MNRLEVAAYWCNRLAIVCFLIWIAMSISACAPIEQRPPEQRTQVVTADKPIAAPCFTEEERPVLAPLTPVDIDHATADQLADALRADAINEDLFVKAVDAIFLKCLKPGGTK